MAGTDGLGDDSASGSGSGRLSFVVGSDLGGQRVDQALAELCGVPRAKVSRWITMGQVRVDGLPARFSETPWQMTHGGPCLGEHTDEILMQLLDKSPEEVEQLREEGVI